jgi:hypothetical protein
VPRKSISYKSLALFILSTEEVFIGQRKKKYTCGFKNIAYFWRELFDSIAPQNTEIRTVTNSSPLKFNNSAKSLFLNRLSQTDENLK